MQQFQQPDPSRMTDSEAQEVLQLLAERRQRQEEAQGLPTVDDVATLANAHPNEVLDALNEVRAREISKAQAQPVEVRPTKKPPMVVFAIAVVVCMLIMAIVGASTQAVPEPPRLAAPTAPKMSGDAVPAIAPIAQDHATGSTR